MKQSSQKRLIRHFMAAILASDMTENEIKELINELSYDPALIQEIKLGLTAILNMLQSNGVYKHKLDRPFFDGPIEIAYNVIAKRRLSKSNILEMMKFVSGINFFKKINAKQTTREILAHFFSVATKPEQEQFMELLGYKNSDDDAFLQGIIRGR